MLGFTSQSLQMIELDENRFVVMTVWEDEVEVAMEAKHRPDNIDYPFDDFDLWEEATRGRSLLVEKDFDISDEAGGSGKVVVKNYAINGVATLEIQLY
ncbi:hypothetical protein Tco_0925562 [Tanacetum coccineum]|uniref:Uncharacterized protein n=1 Tax=Tanacetum coccineum TaxID=301880 RepID=A0ABQ5DA03_9ASTR